MELKNKMRGDRSGVSTLLIAVIIAAAVVVAAAAAYVVLPDNDEKETWAPGTVMEYDIFSGGAKTGTYKTEIIGQNTGNYFIKQTTSAGTTTQLEYSLDPKKMPEGAVKEGTVALDTKDGRKTLEIWIHQDKRQYIDPSSEKVYEVETVINGAAATLKLTNDDIKWQKSYKESSAIGKKYEYSKVVDGTTYRATIECVADCQNGQYGVKLNTSSYFLSNYPQGLPIQAVNSGSTGTLTNTIDGEVEVQIWILTLAGGAEHRYYIDPASHIAYRLALPESTDANAPLIEYDLRSKS